MEPRQASKRATKLTYADYVAFPDDGLRHEIIDGAHYVTPSPVTRHQRISRNLSSLLQRYLEDHPLGEVFYAPFDVVLSETDIVVPDLLFVSDARAGRITEKNLQGAPDLVIEILSPGTKSRDQRLKRDLYERAGVEEYWIVDPEHDVIDVYRSRAGVFDEPLRFEQPDTLTTPLLPGLKLPLASVLARMPGH